MKLKIICYRQKKKWHRLLILLGQKKVYIIGQLYLRIAHYFIENVIFVKGQAITDLENLGSDSKDNI